MLAINHLAWIDIPLVGGLSPRNINYVAKVEAHETPCLGWLIRQHGTLAVRRGESDRDAVRLMRQAARDGRARRRSSSRARARRAACPARRSRARRWSRSRSTCRSCRSRVYGTQFWKLGNFAPCSIAVGEPFLLEGCRSGGKGYKEASQRDRAAHPRALRLARRRPRARPPGGRSCRRPQRPTRRAGRGAVA